MVSFIARYPSSYRRMKPTITSRRPAFVSASRMRSHASRVVASGFSQKTCLPAAMHASTYSSWVGPHEATMTASTSSSPMRSCPFSCIRAPASSPATALARLRSTSVTATTRAPDSTWVSRRMWSCPIMPTPMTPTLRVTLLSFLRCGYLYGQRRAGPRPQAT